MKKLVLFFFLFSISFSLKAENEIPVIDIVTYHLAPNNDFTYTHIFYDYKSIQLNLPFARDFSIIGNHIHFSISYDDFIFFIVRRMNANVTSNPKDQFLDLCISEYGTFSGFTSRTATLKDGKYVFIGDRNNQDPYIIKEGIIRVYFYK